MKIGVFGYNFPHWKTQAGLLNLCCRGHEPVAAFLQEKKKLDVPRSLTRIAPRGLYLNEPLYVCETLGVRAHQGDHDSDKTVEIIEGLELDLGIVLGARILKKRTIEAFKTGVLNMHPGLIPLNRGLDNVKWAILDGIKQGVTAHLIDERVDMGAIFKVYVMPVYPDDELVDLHVRVQNLEQRAMVETVNIMAVATFPIHVPVVEEPGIYHREVPPELERELPAALAYYKAHYEEMRER